MVIRIMPKLNTFDIWNFHAIYFHLGYTLLALYRKFHIAPSYCDIAIKYHLPLMTSGIYIPDMIFSASFSLICSTRSIILSFPIL